MVLQKLRRILFSCNTLGVKQTGLIVKHRMKRDRFITRMRVKAIDHKAHHNQQPWSALSKKYDLSLELLRKQMLPYIDDLYASLGDDKLVALSNRYANNQFRALGSDWYHLDDIMWHIDIRLKQQGGSDYAFDASLFYADIKIEAGQSEDINKDIKVPWELSRLQHLPLLAQAYKRERNNTYINTFIHHVEHWLTHNRYLLGINWLCPMEVALRSISLVVAFDGFKQADIPDAFWQRYVGLLYDHMAYLEHNWEWYDGRTSNHYLSDLVGYLYLCYFFQSLDDVKKKTDWCIQEIIRESDKQIFAEGTSYEGSTRYHLLVTELLYHVELLCSTMNITLPQSFHQKLARMFEFIKWCSINETDMITIGDHDAGKVLWPGLPRNLLSSYNTNQNRQIKHFEQFGLSIFRNDTWHLSLRHHAYTNRQPSGHHHNDAGSVTLAIKGVPVLVDPGSYVYTASSVWRNRFRSACVHNVMSVASHEPVPFDERLFALNIPEHVLDLDCANYYNLMTRHKLYERFGLIYDRDITIDGNALKLTEVWHKSSSVNEDLFSFFNFTFAPDIVMKKEGSHWLGCYNGEAWFRLETSLNLHKTRGHLSSTYGIKQETVRLCARMPLEVGKEYVCTLISTFV